MRKNGCSQRACSLTKLLCRYIVTIQCGYFENGHSICIHFSIEWWSVSQSSMIVIIRLHRTGWHFHSIVVWRNKIQSQRRLEAIVPTVEIVYKTQLLRFNKRNVSIDKKSPVRSICYPFGILLSSSSFSRPEVDVILCNRFICSIPHCSRNLFGLTWTYLAFRSHLAS